MNTNTTTNTGREAEGDAMSKHTADSIREQIKANVDDFYADRIRHDDFASRNRDLWRTAEAEGVADDVAAIIRDELTL